MYLEVGSPVKKTESDKTNMFTPDRGFSSVSLGGTSKVPRNDSALKEPKRRKLAQDDDDISSETVAEIIAIIDNPNYVTGPDVRNFCLRIPISLHLISAFPFPRCCFPKMIRPETKK